MPFKDLLVHVGTDRANDDRLDYALRFAQIHEAHLTALYSPAVRAIPTFVAAQLPQAVADESARMTEEIASRLEGQVRTAGDRAGVALEWRLVRDAMPEAAMVHARHADLTIIGQGADEEDDRPNLSRIVVENLLLGSGRPILVVPSYGRFPTVGERVLVAWNATREAARALNDALPILKRARTVTVLSVDPPDAARRIPGADVALHLARHGVKVEATSTYAEDIDVGDVLLSRAADLGADMIVSGGYGHARAREVVFGGVTRHLLAHMTVPVFMSH
ncbi:MAG TPA: universal stress protein [Alphaproteobacteria bacterium]